MIQSCERCGKVEAGPGVGDGYGHLCAACEQKRDERLDDAWNDLGNSLREMSEEEIPY